MAATYQISRERKHLHREKVVTMNIDTLNCSILSTRFNFIYIFLFFLDLRFIFIDCVQYMYMDK